MLNFTKMNGAGNDFVLLDNRKGHLNLDAQRIEQLCDRHRGIGADGLIMAEEAQNGADFRMRYYNRDGGEAEMCGNGARCFARFVQQLAGGKEKVRFETIAGVIEATVQGELVRLEMSTPKDLQLNQTINVKNGDLVAHSVNTGVPHAVIVSQDLENTDIQGLGNTVRFHEHFAPKGTNVNFIQQDNNGIVHIRTYERGVEAETLACGTGVVASALIFHELTGTPSPVSVKVRGGDILKVDFKKTESGYSDVSLTGPADFVFEGQVNV